MENLGGIMSNFRSLFIFETILAKKYRQHFVFDGKFICYIKTDRPVSRVLSRTIIYLCLLLPKGS